MIFLMALYFVDRMLSGPWPRNVNRYAISVAMSQIAGALSTEDAGYAAPTRIVLKLTGALAATADALAELAGEERRAIWISATALSGSSDRRCGSPCGGSSCRASA